MKHIISSLKTDRLLLPQLIFVFAAFFVMVLIGSFFGSSIISSNVEAYGVEVVNTTGERINAYLDEYKVILNNVAFSLIMLKDEGRGGEDMLGSIVAWTERIKGSNTKYESFSGFYGVVDGDFVDGSGWDPMNPDSDDYDPDYWPLSRPWHLGAMGAKGDVFFSDPYIDADTGEYVQSASKMLIASDGKVFGVIAMDFFLDDIEEIVNSIKLMDSGFGVLLDSERRIIVTANNERIGAYFDYIDEAHAQIGKSLDTEGGTIHHEVVTDGEEYIVFFKQLPNNWYVGIASLKESYYSDRNLMIITLSLAGLFLALPLCGVLIYLHIRKARADEASNLKTSFLANMSHEIRTPMNAIIGMTELLQNEHLSEQQEGYVKDINTSAQALLSIINDILDLSKIEAGKAELRPVDYDFPSFIDNLVSVFSFVTGEKGLEFRFQKTGNLPECLYGDDIRLRQVLTNIFGNAVKFTSKGYVSLSLSVREHDIDFLIKDTGMGIRKEDLPKIFTPFEQFDMQSNRKIIGTGLGLPISKNFVEMMGGSLKVESIYGEGTAFTVTIPKITGNLEAALNAKIPEKLKSFIAPGVKALIVDDNDVNLKVASGLLRNLYKIEPTTAASGIEAIRLVRENDYDIVFMDHMMPEMDGVQTVREIRKLGGKFKTLKILALTANAVSGVREMFLQSGFDGFISKPIDTGELNDALLCTLPAEAIVTVEKASSEAINAGNSSERFRNAIGAAKEAALTAAGGADNGFLSSLGAVDAINAEIALGRVSGLEEMLEETLELFCSKLPGECERLDKYNESGDLKNFAIAVHGLKSALSAIGAMELSDTAFELEKASKNDDARYCRKHLPGFLLNLRKLHKQLSDVFPDNSTASADANGNTQAGDTVSPELLELKVREAIDACDDFDDSAALEIINSLLVHSCGPSLKAQLKSAKAALKDFDYIAAINALKQVGETV